MATKIAGLAERKLGHAFAISIAVAILVAAVPSFAASPSTAAAAPGAAAEELLELVRDFNPNLAAAALDSEQAAAKIVPAGALDDPTLNLSRDQGFRQTLVSISQDIPLWGKRELRTDVATADAEASRARERSVGKDLEERVKVTLHNITRRITPSASPVTSMICCTPSRAPCARGTHRGLSTSRMRSGPSLSRPA
jgi:hypothetical protein